MVLDSDNLSSCLRDVCTLHIHPRGFLYMLCRAVLWFLTNWSGAICFTEPCRESFELAPNTIHLCLYTWIFYLGLNCQLKTNCRSICKSIAYISSPNSPQIWNDWMIDYFHLAISTKCVGAFLRARWRLWLKAHVAGVWSAIICETTCMCRVLKMCKNTDFKGSMLFMFLKKGWWLGAASY